MKSKLLILGLAVAMLMTAAASAQYRRSSRRGRGGYGYGGGFGSIFSGMGQFNLYTAQAATSYQQAYHQWVENEKLRAQTYFDMRRMNASYKAEMEMQHPHATPDELAAFNQARLPGPLSANVFDPAHGVLEWPPLLTRSEFDDPRHKLEGLFSQWSADPHGSGLGTQNYRDIQHAVAEMSDKLHSEIAQFSPDEYIAASKFLKMLGYQARSPSDNTVAAK